MVHSQQLAHVKSYYTLLAGSGEVLVNVVSALIYLTATSCRMGRESSMTVYNVHVRTEIFRDDLWLVLAYGRWLDIPNGVFYVSSYSSIT